MPHGTDPARPCPNADPLKGADYRAIAAAALALRPARRAERVATTSGWLTLLAGVASLPFATGSGLSMAFGVMLGVIGWRELSLRAGLRDLEPATCGRLARNQIALGVTLAGYGLIRLVDGPASLDALGDAPLAGAPELEAVARNLTRLAHYGVYGGLVLGAFIAQGIQAAYYARVGRRLRRLYAAGPMWVMRVHAACWGGKTPEGLGVTPMLVPVAGQPETPETPWAAA